jgi:hypothetical protein
MNLWFSGIVSALGLIAGSAPAGAVPASLTFTGRLADGGEPVDGAVTLQLSIYDLADGGAPLWSENQATTAVAGLLSFAVGEHSALDAGDFDGGDRWLEVTVDGAVLSPRFQIRSVPYAIRAGVCDSADTLAGLDPDDLALSSHDHDGVYAPALHDHDGVYAAAGHLHSGTYAPATHDHDNLYYPRSALDSAGTINTATNPVHWTRLKNVPAGLADGVDNDSGGDITGVVGGIGLSGSYSSGQATLDVDFGGTGVNSTAARSDHHHDSRYVTGNYTMEVGQIACGSGGCADDTAIFSLPWSSTPRVLVTPVRDSGSTHCQVVSANQTGFRYSCNGTATSLNWIAIR